MTKVCSTADKLPGTLVGDRVKEFVDAIKKDAKTGWEKLKTEADIYSVRQYFLKK